MLWFLSIRRQHQIPQPGLRVGDDVIVPSDFVRDLGIYLNCDVSMRTHVSKVVSSCFAVLRRLRSIRSSVTRPVVVSLVVSLVLSRLDYGNATLAVITDRLMDRLRSVLNASARLIYASRRTDHVTPLLRDLHCFDIPIGSTTSWRCWFTDASIDWRRATSSTNSSACRRLCRDGTFGRHRRPIMLCLAFSGRNSTIVHSLWQRLKHETAYRHMSHHLHRWRHSNAASRLSCSWDRSFKPDIGWCSTSLLWLCHVPSKSTLIYVMLIIFVINKSLSTILCHGCEMNMLYQAESLSIRFWVSDLWNPWLWRSQVCLLKCWDFYNRWIFYF